jgi:hypothetical protein
MFHQLSKVSKPLLAAILGLIVAWWKKSRHAKKALTACALLSIDQASSAKKVSIPDKVEGDDKIATEAKHDEVAIKDTCIVQWVGGRGCLTTVKVQEKVKAAQEIVPTGPIETIHWVGGSGKINSESKVTKECAIQWRGGRGGLTNIRIPKKADDVAHSDCTGTSQSIQWIGGRGVLTNAQAHVQSDVVQSDVVTPRTKFPSYQLPTPMKIPKEVNEESGEYNEIVVGDKVRYSDGQEGVFQGCDNDGDMIVRKFDGSSTVWYASKCSKTVVEIGDVVSYSCGTRARVDSFDPDGDIVVRKASGDMATWYKSKTGAPVKGIVA